MESLFPAYFEWWQLPLVFLAGLIGESYGVVVGSGGVVTLFTLSAFGVPLPNIIALDIAGAIGTDLGIVAASRGKLWRHRKLIVALAIPTLIGGMIGTLFLVNISTVWLQYIVVGALAVILIHTLLTPKRPKQSLHELQVSKHRYLVLFIILVILSIYTTTISIGEGTFAKLALVGLLGMGFVDSMVIRGVAVLPARIFSLIVTALSGLIVWPYLISLWAGSFLAGKLVTQHIRKVPDTLLRLLLIVVTVLYLVYLLLK